MKTYKEAWEQKQKELHEKGDHCGDSTCQKCCSHYDRDHGICLDCGNEEDAGAAIDRAMDLLEDR